MTVLTLFIYLLTFLLVVNCLLLMLLVLIQLPKKEAGAGVAFGGAATDALFGAGSGSALTQITKYAASVFLGLSLGLSILWSIDHGSEIQGLDEQLRNMQQSGGSEPSSEPGSDSAAPVLTNAVPSPAPSEAEGAPASTVPESSLELGNPDAGAPADVDPADSAPVESEPAPAQPEAATPQN